MSEINLSHAFHSDPVIQIRDLCVDYITDNGDFNAVKSVSFDIGKGEVFGLAGESGCGKSTIAFSINRLHKPPAFISGGQILFQGKDILRLSNKELSALRWSEIAMVFQSAMNSLNPVLTIQEQFADVLRHHQGLSNEQAKDRAEKLLDLVNIPRDRLGEYPHQFSGGMRQRLVIAIALSLNPKLIIMDEPTTPLHPKIVGLVPQYSRCSQAARATRSTSMSQPIIQMKNVIKEFTVGGGFAKEETFRALQGVSFDLYAGRTLALVGESGCGKSTCARLITKVYPASEGEILFNGTNINDIISRHDIQDYRSKVQMVFQDPFGSLNPTHTIRHHLTRPLKIHKQVQHDREIPARLDELLKLVELPEETLNKCPHELSGGQRQRVNLARALAVGSQIILADEPTSMLDVSIRLGVLNLMQRMKQELGIGFLYITHDLATAHYIAEETAVMYKGQIVEWGDTHAILKNPQHPYTKLLISAVPDPDLPFGNLVKNEPNYSIDADEIRHRSSVVVDEYDQVGPNHFVKQWIETA